MPDSRLETGQATVEWVALILLLALVLGGLLALRTPPGEAGLGDQVAARITCAAAGSCSRPAPLRGGGGGRAGGAGRTGPRAPGAALPGRVPPATPGPEGAPGPERRAHAGRPIWLQGPGRMAALLRSGRATAALRRLRGAGTTVAKRAWLGCLAYGRYRWEREHPTLTPRGIPPGAALSIANECLNPLSFLGG